MKKQIKNMYAIKFCGKYAFIKEPSVLRADECLSLKFLPSSALKGIEKHLLESSIEEEKKIIRYRLHSDGIHVEQMKTRPLQPEKDGKINYSILKIGLLKNPSIYLLFEEKTYAEKSIGKHIWAGRQEYFLFPKDWGNTDDFIKEMTLEEFEAINGWEFSQKPIKGFEGLEYELGIDPKTGEKQVGYIYYFE